MTVSPRVGDNAGTLLQSNITALTSQISATSSPLHKAAMQAQLDQLQRELVYHYLDVNRLSAATILSTMT
jgi:hypothetical protein